MDEARENRICRFCSSGQVEDEVHVILHCHSFHSQRKILIDKTQLSSSDIPNEYEVIKKLMYDHLIDFAKFIHAIWKSIETLKNSA